MARLTSNLGKLKAKGLIRDKDGNPKFSSSDLVARFWPILSDEDKVYLLDKFNLHVVTDEYDHVYLIEKEK